VKVIVTGAAGFVGTTLLRGKPPADDLVLVDPAPIDPGVLEALHRRGTRVRVRPDAVLGDEDDADVLLMLAGQSDVDEALADPSLAFTVNPAIALDAAEWWRRHPRTRVVYLSTDEVLGVPGEGPLTEQAPMRPTQPYAASKAMAETLLRCYRDTYDMDLTVIRSCNLVGGYQRAAKLIPTAVQEMAAGRPVPVAGDGHQTREYLAAEDVCNVLRMAVDGTLPADTYHCSSAVSFTVFEVVDVIAEALALTPSLVSVPDRLVQDRAYTMDPSLLHSFGWKPRLEPAEAIARAAVELQQAWAAGANLRARHPGWPLRGLTRQRADPRTGRPPLPTP
jgi:dTDP-glucose 4,6-dehydratase